MAPTDKKARPAKLTINESQRDDESDACMQPSVTNDQHDTNADEHAAAGPGLGSGFGSGVLDLLFLLVSEWGKDVYD